MAKKNNQYFNYFISMMELSCKASEHLLDSLKNFSTENITKQREIMHEIEHTEDEIKHEMVKKLAKEFVTPIDREDIISLANEMDNITDKIEDILIRIDMYGITEIKPEAIEFAETIVNCCKALYEIMIDFPNFQKSKTLSSKIIDINTLEGEGDKIYDKAVTTLFKNRDVDPIEIYSWNKLFDLFEDCCDTCEDVANVIESVIMKNS